MYTLGKIIQGRKDAGLTTCSFFLDVQKTYDTVWKNGLLKRLWEIRDHRKYEDGTCEKYCDAGWKKLSKYFDIRQGVAQGCALLPNMFKVYTTGLIVAVEAAKQGVTAGEGTVSGFRFEDDHMGTSETPEGLQKRIREGARIHY